MSHDGTKAERKTEQSFGTNLSPNEEISQENLPIYKELFQKYYD